MPDLKSALAPLCESHELDLRDYRVAGLGPLAPKAVLWHHTAGPPGDMPDLGTVIHGRPWQGPNGETFLKGPLCNLLIGRTGTVGVISDGKANHAGVGAWPGLSGSSDMIGIEVENDGVDEPWSPALMKVCALVGAQLSRVFAIPAELHLGHKEWAQPPGRKTDPSFDMAAFRVRLAAVFNQPATTPLEAPDMIRLHVVDDPAGAMLELSGNGITWIRTGDLVPIYDEAHVPVVDVTVAQVQNFLATKPAIGPSPSQAGSAVAW